jgi:hypothetical protein
VVKARKVKRLDCDAPVVENARRIIAVRLDEMLAFGEFVHDPANVTEIHNLRIAAKRLRYTLELFRFAFPSKVGELIDEVKEIQEHIGEMHDADVMRARVLETLNRDATLRTIRLVEIASATDRGTIAQRHQRLRSAMTNKSVPRDEVALLTLVAHRADDEHAAYRRFLAAWSAMQETDFPGRLRRLIGIDPEPHDADLDASPAVEPAAG